MTAPTATDDLVARFEAIAATEWAQPIATFGGRRVTLIDTALIALCGNQLAGRYACQIYHPDEDEWVTVGIVGALSAATWVTA